MAKRMNKAKRATRKPAAAGAMPSVFDHYAKQRDNDRYTPAQVIAALEVSAGINAVAARKLGCAASTVGYYIDRYPEIAAAKAHIESESLDVAESVVLRHMQQEKLSYAQLDAAKFYLKTKGRVRGYVEGRELSGPRLRFFLCALAP